MPKTPTRDKILDALEGILFDFGPAKATLEAVAEAAGVSKGGLLYHFPSKQEMLIALVDRHTQRSIDQMASAVAAGRSVGEVYLEMPSETWQGEASLLRSMIAIMRSDDGRDERLRAAVVKAVRVWDAPLRESIADPVQAEIIRLIGDGLLLAALVDDYPTDAELHRKMMAQLLDAE